MQLTSYLLITSALLAMGEAANTHRFRTDWQLINPANNQQLTRRHHPSLQDASEENTSKLRQFVVAFDNVKVEKRKPITTNDNSEEYEKYMEMGTEPNSERIRIKQWHNYPRRLDKLERFKRENRANEIEDSEERDSERTLNFLQSEDLLDDDSNPLSDLENFLVSDLAPILILRIQLSFLRNLKDRDDFNKNDKRSKNALEDFGEIIDMDEQVKENVPEYPVFDLTQSLPPWRPEIKTIYITRGRLPSSQSPHYYEMQSPERRRRSKRKGSSITVSKRIFSFLTRMQGMHSSRDLEHRRHFHSFAGFPSFDSNGDIVSAETRALIRPPGSPLRWG